ncbi:DUF2971 domain-containing protein [Vibrio astriarenae]
MANYYKFRQVDKYSLSALAGYQLWFDKLSNQNDPFEGSYKSKVLFTPLDETNILRRFGTVTDELLDIVRTEAGVMNPHRCNPVELVEHYVRAQVGKALNNLQRSYICSMSNSDTSQTQGIKDPIKNTLMWGHYAGGLRGFCLVFDADKLADSIFCNTHEKAHPVDVTYSNEPATIHASDIIRITTDGLVLDSFPNVYKILRETTARKSLDWRGENEVRFISHGTEQLVSFDPQALVKVVVGEKMPASDRALLQTILEAKYQHVHIEIAGTKYESYELRFRRVDTLV